MIRLLALALFLIIGGAGEARAQLSCPVPFTLQNGTVADATSVMSNFNTISGCISTLSTNGQLSTPHYQALKAITGMFAGVAIYRAGFSTPGDGGGAFYAYSLSSCTLNSGNGDNGSQVAPNTGVGCWNADLGNSQAPPTAMIWEAKCDATTDDTQAFTQFVNWVNAQNAIFQMPRGRTCVVNVAGSSFVLTSTGAVQGSGIPGAGGGSTLLQADLASSSVLRDVSGGSNPIIQVTTGQSISFHDLMFDAVPAKPSGAPCVQLIGVANTVAYQRSTNFDRTEFRGCTGIDVAYAVDIRVDHSIFLDYPGCGINENQRNGTGNFFDFGDWRVTDTLFFELTVSTGTGFCQLNGSGGTFLSNTVNGGQYAYRMCWNGSHSEETRIIGNIINQTTQASIGVFQCTNQAAFSELTIANNQISNQVFSAGATNNPKYGDIYVEKGVPPSFDERWDTMIKIVGNTLNDCYDNSQGSAALIWVRDGDNITISGNSAIQNNNASFGVCTNADVSGVSFIQTEGSSYLGDSNRSGVEVCSVTDNVISFAYQFYSGMSGYFPAYGTMAPLCVINDANYHTAAMDPHLGFGRTVDKEFNVINNTVTGWTTVDMLSPSISTALNATGTVHAILDAHTALTAFGTNDSLWEYRYTAGVLSVAAVRADVTSDSLGGGGFPQFRLTCGPSGTCPGNGTVLMQMQSSDGTHAIDGGHGHFTIDEAAVNGVAQTFYWTLTPASP